MFIRSSTLLLSLVAMTCLYHAPLAQGAGLKATISASSKNPVALKKSVTLTCKATGGTSPYTYSWTEKGEAGVKSTKATYTTKSDDKDTDTYKCSVTDSATTKATSTDDYKVVFSGASGLPLTFAITVFLPLLATFISTVKRG